MRARLQPYRIESTDGNAQGVLTAYYEPMIDAARQPGNGFTVPVYRVPATLGTRKPTRSVPVLEATEAQLARFPARAPQPPAPAAALAPAQSSYPPLESTAR